MRRLQYLLIFISFLGLYLRTSCPTVHVGDDGDMITAGYLLGVPHPSGYPLFVLLAKATMLVLPLSNLAQRINILSGLVAALTLVLLFTTARLWLSAIPSAMSTLIFGLSPSFWSQSTVSRVYVLNLLMVVILLRFANQITQRTSARQVYAYSFASGLALGNHLVAAVAGMIWAITWVLVTRLKGVKTLWQASAFGLLGFSVYLYLPLRSLLDPPLDWGNPQTYANWLKVLLRSDFWYKRAITDWSSLVKAAIQVIDYLRADFTTPLLIVSLVGILLGLFKFTRLVLVVVSLGVGAVSLVFLHGSEYDLYHTNRYFLPSYLVVALGVGLAFQLVTLGLQRIPWRLGRRGGFLILGACCLVQAPFFLIRSYYFQDRSDNYILYDYSQNILKSVDYRGTIMALRDNQVFGLLYQQYVERARPDVILYNTAGAVLQNSKLFEGVPVQGELRDRVEKQVIEAAPSRVYYCEQRDLTGFDPYGLMPHGIIYRVVSVADDIQLFPYWERYCFRGIYKPLINLDLMISDIMELYLQATNEHYRLAKTVSYINDTAKLAAAKSPAQAAPIWHELGQMYAERKLIGKATDYFLLANEADPGNTVYLLKAALGLRVMNRVHESLTLLQQILAVRPRFEKAVKTTAEIYEQAYQDYAQALIYWRRYRTLIPDSNERRWVEAHITALDSLLAGRDFSRTNPIDRSLDQPTAFTQPRESRDSSSMKQDPR